MNQRYLRYLYAYWTHHVNRFGIYDLNLNHCPPTLDFDTVIIPALQVEVVML
jgi:hypothetical protein